MKITAQTAITIVFSSLSKLMYKTNQNCPFKYCQKIGSKEEHSNQEKEGTKGNLQFEYENNSKEKQQGCE